MSLDWFRVEVIRFLDDRRSVYFILVAHFAVWFALAGLVDIHPDMADHWQWSRHLAFGYYEHPPMVAWTMRLATIIGGNREWVLDAGAVLFSVLIFYLQYQVGCAFFGQRAAVLALLIMEATPYFSAGSVFWHINQPLMLFWLLGMLAFARYIRSENRIWILVFGVIAGLGALSKYTYVLFYLSVLVWCVWRRDQRHLLSSWQPYAAGVLSLLVLAPNLYWNATHDWVSIRFQLEKGGGATFGENTLPFLLGHLADFGPIFTLWFWGLLFRGRLFGGKLSAQESFVACLALVPALFFTVASLKGQRLDPTWLNVSYLGCFLLLARHVAENLEGQRFGGTVRWFAGAYALNTVAVALLLVVIFFPVMPANSGLSRSGILAGLIGWPETGAQITELLEQKGVSPPPYVISREYQLSGALAFYLPYQPDSHSLENAERNAWSPPEQVAGGGGLVVVPPDEAERVTGILRQRFDNTMEFLGTVRTERRGNLLRELQVYYLRPLRTALPAG